MMTNVAKASAHSPSCPQRTHSLSCPQNPQSELPTENAAGDEAGCARGRPYGPVNRAAAAPLPARGHLQRSPQGRCISELMAEATVEVKRGVWRVTPTCTYLKGIPGHVELGGNEGTLRVVLGRRERRREGFWSHLQT